MRLSALMALALLLPACAPLKPIPGVVQPGFGETLTSVPGPMPGFGPFERFPDALMAACPAILSKPRATAGRPTDQDFKLRWMLSQEYCAWLYYTPTHQYEMSMLVAGRVQNDSKKRTCDLPSTVNDPRYVPESLGYVFVLHNHPYENVLSDFDIHFIVEMAAEHGVVVETRAGEVPLSIVAFFSSSNDLEHPSCDGFFQYIPGTGELLRWSNAGGNWTHEITGRVVWTGATTYRIDEP